jgi:hypothetical protein
MITDILRPPVPGDPTAEAYKDWLHLNIFDRASGLIAIVNVSLHGALDDPRARAAGTALFALPGSDWIGNIELRALRDAHCGLASLGLEHVAIAIDVERHTLLASVRWPDERVVLRVEARALNPPIDIDIRMPFGPGWMAWLVAPRLEVRGDLVIGETTYDLGNAVGYHDHNWGRWRWGDDIGWTWGAFVAPAPGPVIVASRATDRLHRHDGGGVVVVDVDAARRVFAGASVALTYEGSLATRLRRLPGALAALHQDRATPPLPATIHIRADDGVDRVAVRFQGRAAAQLVAGDPSRSGYGFIHSMIGDYDASGIIAGEPFACSGPAVMEHAD